MRPTTGTNPTPVNPAELLARLQPNQTLLAKVERILANNEVELRIGNQSIRANSPIPLSAGQSINLLVEESNNGLILRIAQQSSQADVIARALRTVLPKQQAIADVVKLLVQNLASNKEFGSVKTDPTANSLRSTIQNFVSNLPNIKSLSQAEGLRQAIRNSGVNLESHLRQSIITGQPPQTTHDIKANFLRIAQTALQLQSNPNTTVINSAISNNPISNSNGKTNSLEAYTALLNAASKQTPLTDKAPLANRPLLPPLPVTTPSTTKTESSITQRLISSLPPALQRLLPTPFITTAPKITPAPLQTQPVSQQVFSTMIVELLNQMESGLARIQQHQLHSISSDDAIRHFLGLELPVFNGKDFDNIGVKIEWQEKTDDDTEKNHQWRVILNFDFDELGKTQVEIRAGESEIHTDFKSEKNTAQQLFRKNKEILATGLREHGLTPGIFTFSTGDIEPTTTHSRNENLVKTKA
ncbi:MAG: flagellar hook-length control protein FliK [Sulfuriflexus sp.]|nr:flagellar hook-length control protein FliK [Sulfuriflexus sp.]